MLCESINAALTGGYKFALAFPAQIIHMTVLIIMFWMQQHQYQC